MADIKRFRIKDRNGNVITYDIEAGSITIDAEHKSLPQKLAEMESAIHEAGQSWTPTEESIAMGNLSQAVQALLGKAGTAVQPNDLTPINEAITTINRAIDAITGTTDTTELIDSLNEVVAFLTGIENDQTLSGKLLALQQAIDAKQDALTFDKAPTAGSDNPVESGGVYTALEEKANADEVYDKGTVDEKLERLHTLYYNKGDVDNAISQMEATIEQSQLTVITGDKLSMWLDEDGESINIMAGEVPDIAAAPTISHVINNDGTATVTITNNEVGATIYYTTNGDTPTESSSEYSSALTINTAGSYTIKAIAVIADKLKSSVATDTFSVVACTTPTITVDNSDRNQAVVTATAGNDESVSLTVGGQTATGTGEASVIINKTTSSQTLSASATATATGKLTATATQNVTVDEKQAYVFGEHSLGGKASSANVPIKVTTTSDFQNQLATLTPEDGVVWWEIDLQGHLHISNNSRILYNAQAGSTSIFDTDGGANILTIEHIPEELTEIRDNVVFNTCTNMTLFKTTGNTNLAKINSAFRGLPSLKTVILPNSVTSIPFGAFQNTSELESVSAPSATTIDQAGFSGCSKLVSLMLGTLTAIAKEAFYGCEAFAFTGIDFSNVTSFGESAFKRCKALTSFTLRNVIKIPNYMFYECTSLTTLDLPSDLEEIGTQAFMWGCTQLELVLPSTISKIGSSATQFAGIASVTINRAVPPTLSDNGLYGTFLIYVPDANVEDYKTAWSSLTSRIKGISEKQ